MIVKNPTGNKVDKLRKLIHREFKSLNLNVKISANIKRVAFLDVTNLVHNNFQLNIKNNANLIYIHPNLAIVVLIILRK